MAAELLAHGGKHLLGEGVILARTETRVESCGQYFCGCLLYTSVELERQAVRLAPDYVWWYGDLANYSLDLQRSDEARQIIHEAQARKMDALYFHEILYAIAFLGADSGAIAEQQQWFSDTHEYENFGLALASNSEAYGGHLDVYKRQQVQPCNPAIG